MVGSIVPVKVKGEFKLIITQFIDISEYKITRKVISKIDSYRILNWKKKPE